MSIAAFSAILLRCILTIWENNVLRGKKNFLSQCELQVFCFKKKKTIFLPEPQFSLRDARKLTEIF